MGKSSQILTRMVAVMQSNNKEMRNHQNTNLSIKLLKNHSDTFLFHQLQDDASLAHAFDLGTFFNKQGVGLRLKELAHDEVLSKMIEPLATFQGSARIEYTEGNLIDRKYDTNEEFIAIAEGIDIPLYIFTYNVEMTQFVNTEIGKRDDQTEMLDKSIPARHHAQFIAH